MSLLPNYGVVENTKPIMVSGVYRSGTTFLSAMLGAHSTLRASSSTVKFLRFCLDRYGDVSIKAQRQQLIQDTHKRIHHRWNLHLDEAEIMAQLEEHNEISYALIYDIIMRNMLVSQDTQAKNWVEKLAVQWEDIPLFLDMFPNGKAIHIFRDPRDVTASFKEITFESDSTFLDAAFNFRSAVETLNSIRNQYADRVLTVRAEDIAQRPAESARSLCQFLDLKYENAMVDVGQFHSEGEDWASNTSFGKNYTQLPDAKPRWPEKLLRPEVIFIEMVTQPYLSDLGYSSSGFYPNSEDWNQIYSYLEEPFISDRFKKWLTLGKGSQGFKTDPYTFEMKMVFPERYTES